MFGAFIVWLLEGVCVWGGAPVPTAVHVVQMMQFWLDIPHVCLSVWGSPRPHKSSTPQNKVDMIPEFDTLIRY